MAEPSLSEIENITRDPGAGTVAPRTAIDTQSLVHEVNQAAQFKAENDWRKYSSFKNDLKDVYKQLGDIQGMEVAQADQPYLKKQSAEIFDQIANDPQKFFAGGMGDIQKKLGNLYRESAQSVQDNIYDNAHRMYLDRDPSLQNDDNKKIMEDYFKAPLGQRKPYTLKLPSLYNPQEIGAQINAIIPQKFSNTGLSPDGKYINSVTGIRYDEKQYKQLADQMFNMPDSRGMVLANQVADRFKSLPPALQDAYKQKYPQDPVKGFYDETVMPWRKPDQIEKTEQKEDQFAIQQLKHKQKLQEQNVKFGYDKILEGMKIGGQKELATFKENIKDKSKKEQVGAVSGLVDKAIAEAYTGTPQVGDDMNEPYYTIPVSPKTLGIYSYKKGINKEVISPDKIVVNESGDKVRVVFYNRPGNPNSGIDTMQSKTFSKGEFKVRAIRDMIGQTATEKEINSEDEDDDESSSTSESSSSSSPPTTVTQGGYTYTLNPKTGKYE